MDILRGGVSTRAGRRPVRRRPKQEERARDSTVLPEKKSEDLFDKG